MDDKEDHDSSTLGEEPPVESDENPNPTHNKSTRPRNQRNQTNRNQNRKGLSYKCKCGKLKGEGKHICPFTLTFADSIVRLPSLNERKLPFSNFDRWTTNNVPNEELTEQDRRHQKLWRETEGRREKARVVSGPPSQEERIHKAPKGIGKTGQPQYCRCKQLRKPRHGHHCPYNTSLFDAAYLYQKSKDGSSRNYSLYDGWSGKVLDEQLQDFDAEWRDHLGMGGEKPIASPPQKRSKLGQSVDSPLLQSNLPADDDRKQPAVEREDGSGAILDQDVVEARAVASLPTPDDLSEPSLLMDDVSLPYLTIPKGATICSTEAESVPSHLEVDEDILSCLRDGSWLDDIPPHSAVSSHPLDDEMPMPTLINQGNQSGPFHPAMDDDSLRSFLDSSSARLVPQMGRLDFRDFSSVELKPQSGPMDAPLPSSLPTTEDAGRKLIPLAIIGQLLQWRRTVWEGVMSLFDMLAAKVATDRFPKILF